MIKRLLFVLNIYLLFPFNAIGQDLHLNIYATKEQNVPFIDSLIYNKKHASFLSITKELDTIVSQLQFSGYINISKSPLEKLNDTLFKTTFNLGTKIDSLIVDTSNSNFQLNELLKVDTNATINKITIDISKTESILRFLNDLQVSRGSPFSSTQLTNFKIEGEKIFADLITTAPNKRTIDNVIVKGYEKFPSSFIKYGARIKKKQLYNNSILQRKSEQLNNLRFASSNKSPEVLFSKDSTTVFLYLERKKANLFDGFIGFANNEETNKTEFNGYLDLELINNLNYGESLKLKYKSDGREQVQFNANIYLPYVLQSPLGISLDLNIFKRDSTFLTVDQAAQLVYPITNKATVSAGYRSRTSTDLREVVSAGSSITDYTSQFITVNSNIFSSSSNTLFPIKYEIKTEAIFGRRKLTASETNQVGGTLDIQYSLPINQRNYVYARNISTVLVSENHLTNELQRIGGILSIRGFEENSIDNTLSNIIQTEYRYLLSNNLYTHSVIDYGYYENDLLSIKEQLVSFGFGLGLLTNSGLLKVVFANGKTESQSFKFSNTKVHLSLTARF